MGIAKGGSVACSYQYDFGIRASARFSSAMSDTSSDGICPRKRDAPRQIGFSPVNVTRELTCETRKNVPTVLKVSKRANTINKAKPSRGLLEAKLRAKQQLQQRAGANDAVVITDHLQLARESKHQIRKVTGVIYDERVTEHRCPWDDEFPERPERFSVVLERCRTVGLLDRCCTLTPRLATEEELRTVHTADHIRRLRSICEQGKTDFDSLEEQASLYDSVYFHPSTFHVSSLSAGSTLELTSAVLNGQVGNGMAIVRPPGHHATENAYCGYSYFNNAALAAKYALESAKLKRVLIVDFDVHHGQGTQQAFYDDPRVLYFSTHRYENGNFWPHLEESDFNFIGKGTGLGFNVNVPLNKTGLGNSDFLAIWHNILIPLAYQFNPELVIVSAGFDSAFGDEKGEMDLEPRCFPHLIWPLLALASGKVVVILEGGYCLQSLAEGAALTLRALLGDPCPRIQSIKRPDEILANSVLNSLYMLQQRWPNFSVIKFANQEELEDNIHLPSTNYEWTTPVPERHDTRNCYVIPSEEEKLRVKAVLNKQISETVLTKAPERVCLVYNEVMLKHQSQALEGHPERPERISSILNLHGEYGLLERMLQLSGREATDIELKLIHTEEHVQQMKSLRLMQSDELKSLEEKFTSVYLNKNTCESAAFSAGSVLQVTETVLSGHAQSGVAIVRPPGHHAELGEACGFCIFNNVALAAKLALEKFGLKRLLILDWDVHHGNGIQRAFQDDARVLYISIHRYDNGSFFPCSEEADSKFVGVGAGEGFTVNIPWNGSGMGDVEYKAAMTKVVLPIAYQFNPELVLVAAGFDAAKGDPLGGCKVTPECYGHMTHMLSSLANGKVVIALEGGYNLASISHSMVMCTKALLGDPLPSLTMSKEMIPSAVASIQNCLKTHANYWDVVVPFLKTLPVFDETLVPCGNYGDRKSLENCADLTNLKIE